MEAKHHVRAGIVIASVATLLACGGCGRKLVDQEGVSERDVDDKSGAEQRVGTTTVTGAERGSMANDAALERIAAARCARETACNNVGTDKHYANQEACARELRKQAGSDFPPNRCPRGLDPAAIDKCTEAIHAEGCNNPVDTLSRLTACRASDMCLKAGAQRPN